MEVIETAIPEVRIIVPRKHGDHRGFFSEVWSRRALESAGIDIDFVQDNHSLSAEPGTPRGLHFPAPPPAQPKRAAMSPASSAPTTGASCGSPGGTPTASSPSSR